jgi:hypothetical protein
VKKLVKKNHRVLRGAHSEDKAPYREEEGWLGVGEVQGAGEVVEGGIGLTSPTYI